MANNVTNEQIRVSLDVLTPSQSIVDLAVRFPIYVINEYHTVQSDCEQTDTSAGDYIKNKPNLDLKADKVTNATGGNFASLDSNGNIVDSERSVEKVDNNDTSNLPTLDKVNALLEAMPEPMQFKGSLGTGGTITTLPDVSSLNEGFTYKVITAGTYAGQIAKIGDTFISDGTQWVLIPSGDEPSGTVTSIKIKANTPINIDTDEAITNSGERTISHANSGAIAGNYGDSAAQTPAYGATFKVPYVAVNATGHVTEISEHTVKIPASDNTDTHRPIQMNGTEILGNDTTALNLKAGSNVTLTNSSGTVTIASSDSTKADKVSSATNGNFAGLDANGNLIDSGKKVADFQPAGNYKTTQSAVPSPTASGSAKSFIDSIAQDGNGVITATKKTLLNALMGSGYGTCSTAAATTEKSVVLSNYEKELGGLIVVKFDNAVPANATLNINSKGANVIYYTGSPITDNIIKAGDKALFMYTTSTNYTLITTGRLARESVVGLSISGTTITITKADGSTSTITTQDTKNTAGSTDSSSKLYLIGATSQADNPQTYSDDEVYTTNGVLTTKAVQVGGGKVRMEYDTTTDTLKFNFI